MHSRFVRPTLWLSGALLALLAAPQAQAQRTTPQRTAAPRSSARPGLSSDQASYRKEFIYGINFNTRGGLIGGATVRSTHLLTQDWARFWSLEMVEIKHPKEQKYPSDRGGTYVPGKSNYFYSLRPSVGLQRVIFRKAPDAGVQVNGLLSAGPSIGLQMPYFISYNYSEPGTARDPLTDVRNEQYDPRIHNPSRILDRAPLFAGVGETKVLLGGHLRGALSFEYGRYRDAVAGVEVGALLEAYTSTPVIIRTLQTADKTLNDQFLPSVYLTVYLGSRN